MGTLAATASPKKSHLNFRAKKKTRNFTVARGEYSTTAGGIMLVFVFTFMSFCHGPWG